MQKKQIPFTGDRPPSIKQKFQKKKRSQAVICPPDLPAVAFKPMAFVFSTQSLNTDFIAVNSGLAFNYGEFAIIKHYGEP